MRAAGIPTADPQLELRRLPDPGFLIQGFLIQCLRRIHINLCLMSRFISLPPPQPQDLRGGGFYPGLRPPDQPHTLAMARLTMLRNLDTRARVEDLSIYDQQQGLFDRFAHYFNGDHRRQRVEHYCHEDRLPR